MRGDRTIKSGSREYRRQQYYRDIKMPEPARTPLEDETDRILRETRASPQYKRLLEWIKDGSPEPIEDWMQAKGYATLIEPAIKVTLTKLPTIKLEPGE